MSNPIQTAQAALIKRIAEELRETVSAMMDQGRDDDADVVMEVRAAILRARLPASQEGAEG